jgi:hypothetical protein
MKLCDVINNYRRFGGLKFLRNVTTPPTRLYGVTTEQTIKRNAVLRTDARLKGATPTSIQVRSLCCKWSASGLGAEAGNSNRFVSSSLQAGTARLWVGNLVSTPVRCIIIIIIIIIIISSTKQSLSREAERHCTNKISTHYLQSQTIQDRH